MQSLVSWSDFVSLGGGQCKAFDVVVLTTFWCLWNSCNLNLFVMVLLRKSFLFDDVIDMVFSFVI